MFRAFPELNQGVMAGITLCFKKAFFVVFYQDFLVSNTNAVVLCHVISSVLD